MHTKNQSQPDRFWVTTCSECLLRYQDEDDEDFYCDHPRAAPWRKEEPIGEHAPYPFPKGCPLHFYSLVLAIPSQLRLRPRRKNGQSARHVLDDEREKQAHERYVKAIKHKRTRSEGSHNSR